VADLNRQIAAASTDAAPAADSGEESPVEQAETAQIVSTEVVDDDPF